MLDNMEYFNPESEEPKQEPVFLKEFVSLGTDILGFHLTWQILVHFWYFSTLYDKLMYSIVIDL